LIWTSLGPALTANIIFGFAFALKAKEKKSTIHDFEKEGKKKRDWVSQKRERCQICSLFYIM